MKTASNIIIENEVKTDFVLDNDGNQTINTYEYKEYKVVDENGDVLEVGRYTDESITVEQILERTGIVFGLSQWA
jgi:hypothetical protein